MKFKPGDKVVTNNYFLNVNLGIGRIYTIKTSENDGPFVTLEESTYKKYSFLKKRFTKIEDNPINRLLYPELTPDDEGYLG